MYRSEALNDDLSDFGVLFDILYRPKNLGSQMRVFDLVGGIEVFSDTTH